jgi:hypothetical protein
MNLAFKTGHIYNKDAARSKALNICPAGLNDLASISRLACAISTVTVVQSIFLTRLTQSDLQYKTSAVFTSVYSTGQNPQLMTALTSIEDEISLQPARRFCVENVLEPTIKLGRQWRSGPVGSPST